jgi:O-acetyl-ADP-ribose deacetylase (regulator of RNase III)
MKRRRGSLFDTDAPALGHGVNCAGVMGAGIAKTFKEKYPNNYFNYRAACQTGRLNPGEVFVGSEQGMFIYNMASQNRPGRDASYIWLVSSAYTAAEDAVKMGLDRIAIPMIGCGIGGLQWPKVSRILLGIEYVFDGAFDWEVWRYDANV